MEIVIIIAAAIASIPMSFLAALILYPLYAGLRKVFYVPYVKRRLLKKAANEGRMITAHLVKSETVFRGHGRDPVSSNDGVYEFTHEGKTYRRHMTSQWDLPKTITLFYQKDPKRAQAPSSFGLAENPTWVLQYFVLATICYIVMFSVVVHYAQIHLL